MKTKYSIVIGGANREHASRRLGRQESRRWWRSRRLRWTGDIESSENLGYDGDGRLEVGNFLLLLPPPPPSSAVDIDRPPTKAPLSPSPLSPARADKPESAEPPAASIERSPERTARQPNDGTPEGQREIGSGPPSLRRSESSAAAAAAVDVHARALDERRVLRLGPPSARAASSPSSSAPLTTAPFAPAPAPARLFVPASAGLSCGSP
ncbi:hypothetical protein NL676_014027 [Syzygium grande]|nr:hypothetical protein NL676_014027 [Syzygium grande]